MKFLESANPRILHVSRLARAHGFLTGFMIALLAAMPARADLTEAQKKLVAKLSASQGAALAMIRNEMTKQGAIWATNHQDQDALTHFINQDGFKAPGAFLNASWPYAASLPARALPPGAEAFFLSKSKDRASGRERDLIADLTDQPAKPFILQFVRYLGSMGWDAATPTPLTEAAHLEEKECPLLGDTLCKLYGGDAALWRQAAYRAQKGMLDLYGRAQARMLEHLVKEAVYLKTQPDPAEADARAGKTMVLKVVADIDKTYGSDVHGACDHAFQILAPLALQFRKAGSPTNQPAGGPARESKAHGA